MGKIKEKNNYKIFKALAIIVIILLYIVELFIFIITDNLIFAIIEIILAILIIFIFKKKFSISITLLFTLFLVISIIFYVGSNDRSMLFFEKRKIISYLEKNANTKGFKIISSELKIKTASGWDNFLKIYTFDYETYNFKIKTPDNIILNFQGNIESNNFLGLDELLEKYDFIKQIDPYITEKYKNIDYNIDTYYYNNRSHTHTTIYVENKTSETNQQENIWYDILKKIDYTNWINLRIEIINDSNSKNFTINNGEYCSDKECIYLPLLELERIVSEYYPDKTFTYEYGLNSQGLHIIKIYFNDFMLEENQFYEEYQKWEKIEELARKIDGLDNVGTYYYYYLIYYKNPTNNNYIVLDVFTKYFKIMDSSENTIKYIYCNKDSCN